MSDTTISERQVRALLVLTNIEVSLGGRVPVGPVTNSDGPVTDEMYLTSAEMRDLHARLASLLPQPAPVVHEHTIAVSSNPA